jgi:hypothetical protein
VTWFTIVGFLLFLGALIVNSKFDKKCASFTLFFRRNALNRNHLVLLIWVLVFFVYLSVTPHKEPRYLLPLLPALALLAGMGYARFFTAKNRILPLIIILFALFTFTPGFLSFSEPLVNTWESPEQKVSAYLRTLPEETVLYTNHNYPVFAYYSELPTVAVHTYPAFTEEYPKTLTTNGIFVHYSDIQKVPTTTWLDENIDFERLYELNSIIVYTYTFPGND